MAKTSAYVLKRIARTEQREVSKTARDLGPLWTSAESLIALFVAVADAVEQVAPRDNVPEYGKGLAANMFISSAARLFALEVLDIARRHWAESLLKRRRCLELVAYSWIVWKDAGAALKWLDATKTREPYQAAFGTSRVRGALYELDNALRPAYDELSHRVHPSVHSLVMSVRKHGVSAAVMYRIDAFDDRRFERAHLVHAIKAERLLDTMGSALAALEGYSKRAFSRGPWTKARRLVHARLDRARWRLERDVDHYASLLHGLDEHRTIMRARIRAQQEKRRALLESLERQ